MQGKIDFFSEILVMFLFQTHSEALMMFANLARILIKLRKKFF